jgi:hypothetical protein
MYIKLFRNKKVLNWNKSPSEIMLKENQPRFKDTIIVDGNELSVLISFWMHYWKEPEDN